MMSSFFPQRGRKALKLKFRREEQQHPELVKFALHTGLPLNLSVFEEVEEEVAQIAEKKEEKSVEAVEEGSKSNNIEEFEDEIVEENEDYDS
mmetsp:Transcript_17194/g.23631  ORF Transcript_17194/g.23631 Transcript_17194/m.23631 type:complete len:92 (-) Transcript_17194:45-320(-)